MRLPTFEFPVESGGPTTLIRRMAWFVSPDPSGFPRVRRVWYPAFPPDANAKTVVDWLERRSHIAIREATPADAAFVQAELRRNWNGSEIWSLRRPYAADQLPALVAMLDDEPVGLLTYALPRRGEACEVITLSSRVESRGIGSELLQSAADIARAAGAPRIFLTTSNDNTRAIGFYQREGWDLVALHRGNIDESRRHNPGIARVGSHGIPIRHELELELPLIDP
jgi:ribosomal protein S18 acetylase RimI-like enzyme